MKKHKAFSTLLFNEAALTRITPPGDAGLLLCSLPLPREKIASLSLDKRSTWRRDLGQWPCESAGTPRRALLVAENRGTAPDTLRPGKRGKKTAGVPPTAELVLVEKSEEEAFFWERHAVRIRWQDRTVDFVMGMKVKGEIHWWEACNLVTREESPRCRVVEAGGAIPHVQTDFADMAAFKGYENPFLHRHNWLNGHLGLRLHANGVCEIFAHHINCAFFDEGLPLEDAVPVLGIRTPGGEQEAASLAGVWDGSRETLALGGIRFDLSEPARLATPEKPGALSFQEKFGFLVWQPYLGMELFGGLCPQDRMGDNYIFRAEQQIIPRGMARTLRFSFSMNPKAAPGVARYIAPNWWYGLCEELIPAALLPVFDQFEPDLDLSAQSTLDCQFNRGFEDGSIPRHGSAAQFPKVEPGWEGEVGYAMFLMGWRAGRGPLILAALRSAYHFADVAVDHAAFRVRMHGYPPNAYSVPMERIHVMVAAFLETGDDYLFTTARSVIDTAHWTHKNSWPRMCVGRDACFIRGQMFLYRYFGDIHYRDLARDAIKDVIDSQRPDGSYGDQGGGSGIHGWGAYITKPWMGLMASGGLMDYLDLVQPEDPRVLEAIKKFADWLMRERYDHKGVMGWGYQHYYNNQRLCYHSIGQRWVELPGDMLWHVNYLARLLTFCSLRFDKAGYFDAWAESEIATIEKSAEKQMTGDHRAAQTGQFLPWTQMHLWNARLDETGRLLCSPVYAGARTPAEATVATPRGRVKVGWNNGKTAESADSNLAVDQVRIIP